MKQPTKLRFSKGEEDGGKRTRTLCAAALTLPHCAVQSSFAFCISSSPGQQTFCTNKTNSKNKSSNSTVPEFEFDRALLYAFCVGHWHLFFQKFDERIIFRLFWGELSGHRTCRWTILTWKANSVPLNCEFFSNRTAGNRIRYSYGHLK